MDSALNVNCLQVQQQSNSIDSGIFAIAFAVNVCFGLPPNESSYDSSVFQSGLGQQPNLNSITKKNQYHETL